VKFDYVISRDLVRARQTARLVMEQNRASKNYRGDDTEMLREACYGQFGGEPNTSMMAAFAVGSHIAPFAQTAAVFAIAIKIKNAEQKSAAIAAGIGGIFGITEPIIYGFTLPKKMPFFAASIVWRDIRRSCRFCGQFHFRRPRIGQHFCRTGNIFFPRIPHPRFS
jgi:hypothetical protein